MKPFFRYMAFGLAAAFLIGSGLAWIQVLARAEWLSDPALKTAAAWLVSGLMFLVVGVRGSRRSSGTELAKSSKPRL